MGGGSAGAASWPGYMQTFHGDYLNHSGGDSSTHSVIDRIDDVIDASPYTGLTAYNPDTDLLDTANGLLAWSNYIVARDYSTDFNAVYNVVSALFALNEASINDNEVTAAVEAYSDELDDKLINITLPTFKAGMLNINAVASSSFVIGEAILRSFKEQDVNKFHANMRIELAKQNSDINARYTLQHNETLKSLVTEGMLQLMRQAGLHGDIARVKTEANRVKIAAKSEQAEENLRITESDTKWPLDLYAYANAALGSIGGGGGGHSGPRKPSKTVSALSGAASGAAAGASIGSAFPGYGTVIGAAVGAVAGAGLGYSQGS